MLLACCAALLVWSVGSGSSNGGYRVATGRFVVFGGRRSDARSPSRRRNECLSLEWSRNRMEAKIGIEHWRRHYNEERPHMSLGDLPPAEFKAQIGTTHRWLEESPTGVILQ